MCIRDRCLLTFIGSTLSFFAYFLASLFFDKASDFIVKYSCLLYTSDAADERSSVDLGGRRIIKKKTYYSNYESTVYVIKNI